MAHHNGQISGVFNILATPFDPGESGYPVDLPSLRRLVNFQLDLSAYGLTILGVLGEAAKLTVDERLLVVQTVMETVAGRVPVVVGTSAADTETCIQLSRAAFSNGATAVMISPPPREKLVSDGVPLEESIIAFYERVASAIDGPIVVQDFPPVNNVIMSAQVLVALAERIPTIRHLKLEDPPLMQKISAIQALTDKYQIFGGLGGMFFLEELQRGAAGTMTGFAFTEILVVVYDHFARGEVQTAERIFDAYLPLIRFENQPVINLSIRKELLFRRGAIGSPILRNPYVPIDQGTQDEIGRVLQRVGIGDPTRKISVTVGQT